ncbi:hypothetical protein [Bacillus sp. V5-8f]|uniref:hypothetical protein n=1 Tax=Bacillus sp. V5-8f TaxID=2053044 RepID=UPI000C792E61|nr:hypothetical protein [Bacillus sp. V5-8f]PLT33339.1 hypothetical protein CUU64_13635 [Bacillus sp. V5-8f]
MLNDRILAEMREYVEHHLHELVFVVSQPIHDLESEFILEDIHEREIEDFIKNNRKPSLKQALFSFIDQKGASDPEIYNKAGIDRRLFSKIRSNPNYRPGKNIIVALALALELDKTDTDELLGAAGYSLSNSETADLVIQFCLEKKIYDIDVINYALDSFSLKPLIR